MSVESLTFTLRVENNTTLVVEWDGGLDKGQHDSPYQQLARVFEVITAVERVEVLRFSAFLYLAPGTDMNRAMAGALVVLLTNERFRATLQEIGVANYGVTLPQLKP